MKFNVRFGRPIRDLVTMAMGAEFWLILMKHAYLCGGIECLRGRP